MTIKKKYSLKLVKKGGKKSRYTVKQIKMNKRRKGGNIETPEDILLPEQKVSMEPMMERKQEESTVEPMTSPEPASNLIKEEDEEEKVEPSTTPAPEMIEPAKPKSTIENLTENVSSVVNPVVDTIKENPITKSLGDLFGTIQSTIAGEQSGGKRRRYKKKPSTRKTKKHSGRRHRRRGSKSHKKTKKVYRRNIKK